MLVAVKDVGMSLRRLKLTVSRVAVLEAETVKAAIKARASILDLTPARTPIRSVYR